MEKGQSEYVKKIAVIGGGAAGMAVSIFAARAGLPVVLFEKNETLGRKLFITGKGRCNFTNVCSNEELLNHTVSNSRFLYSAYQAFGSGDAVDFFEGLGVRTKQERGRRAFPDSDHSSDIIRAMQREMQRLGVRIRLKTPVKKILTEGGKASGVLLEDGTAERADAVVVATGGLSYPATGSTGDGYRFAEEAGLSVTQCRPALVPLEAAEEEIRLLQGLSLKNVTLTVRQGKKELFREFGEMLFTHYGVSGPLVLTASSVIGKKLEKEPLQALIDLKPALSEEQLDARILREFSEGTNRRFKNAVADLFPAKLLPVMVQRSGIAPDTPVNRITKGQRLEFVSRIKRFGFTLTGTRDYSEAVITQGGVQVKQINPSSMEAKNVPGLYFIGEVLDVDAFTGGYNLQIAWSTAYQAAGALRREGEEK